MKKKTTILAALAVISYAFCGFSPRLSKFTLMQL